MANVGRMDRPLLSAGGVIGESRLVVLRGPGPGGRGDVQGATVSHHPDIRGLATHAKEMGWNAQVGFGNAAGLCGDCLALAPELFADRQTGRGATGPAVSAGRSISGAFIRDIQSNGLAGRDMDRGNDRRRHNRFVDNWPVEMVEGGGWEFVRVHFKIWPGQGNLIETTFRQQIISAMKTFSPNYAEWQVPVTYRAMIAVKNVKPAASPVKTAA